MPKGWGQVNVINSEIDHAWVVEWMRLAGCSLCFLRILQTQLHPRISSVNDETQSQYQYQESILYFSIRL
jgi:hypothetical protein